jgi:hypothetical protein
VPGTVARCPACDEEFSLGETPIDVSATDDDAEDLPELVPRNSDSLQTGERAAEQTPETAIELQEPVTTPADAAFDREPAESQSLPPPANELEPVVRCPCCRAEYPWSRLIDVSTGMPLVLPTAATARGKGFGEAVCFDISLDPADCGATAAAIPRSISQRKRKRNRGLLGELVQIVLGGILGLSLTYYGLNYFGGPQFDYFKIFLPGVAHTYAHRPPWWPDWAGSRQAGEQEEPWEGDSP